MNRIMVAFFLIFTAGCTDCIISSGNVVSEKRVVDTFDRIKIEGQGEIFLTQGAHAPITIETDDNVLEDVKTSVSDGTLTIRADNCYISNEPIRITLSTEDLKEISIYGSGKVVAMNEMNLDDLFISTEGSGDIQLKGTADSLDVRIYGSGKIDAFAFSTRSADVEIEGSGDVKLNAQELLDVDIRGSGEVSYMGFPQVTQKVAGSGTISSVGFGKLQAIDCQAEQREVEACIEIYQPVCGQTDTLEMKTFENSCKACADASVISYTEWECAQIR